MIGAAQRQLQEGVVVACLRRWGVRACSTSGSSAIPEEVQKFTSIASHWWDEGSPEFGGLHRMNDVRVPLVASAAALPGASVLDVGCGGGILSEALARSGAAVIGVDAGVENVAAAAAHAEGRSLRGSLAYGAVLVEELGASSTSTSGAVLMGEGHSGQFDVVVTSETVEHVANPAEFLANCAALVRPGGALVVTTINRTPASYALAIVAAEHVLGIVPVGTHSWKAFVTPAEVLEAVAPAGLTLERQQGFGYNPVTGQWCNQADVSVNYGLVLRKPEAER